MSDQDDDELTPSEMAAIDQAELFRQRLDIIQRTHQIYCGIKGKDIALLSGSPPGRTDTETFVLITPEDAESDLTHKHEWQHIFFKSNLRARAAFVDAYVKGLAARFPDRIVDQPSSGIAGVKLSSVVTRDQLSEFLHLFVNALDDLRVCSLWELIYPQSAEDIQNRWRRIATMSSTRTNGDLIMFMLSLGLRRGLTPDHWFMQHHFASKWKRYEAVLLDGTSKVMRKGFPACLIAARWILDTIIEDVFQLNQVDPMQRGTLPPPQPAQSLSTGTRRPALGSQKVINRPNPGPEVEEQQKKTADAQIKAIQDIIGPTRAGPKDGGIASILMDTDKLPPGPDPDYANTMAMVKAAMGVSTADQVERLLQFSQSEVDKVVDSLRGRTSTLSKVQRLLRGLEDEIELIDVKDSIEVQLEGTDERAVNVLKQRFSRLMNLKKKVLSEDGEHINVDAYMAFRSGRGDGAFFEDETQARGFTTLICGDLSGSMSDRWGIVGRACKTLAKSMDFPFAKFEVWGFSGPVWQRDKSSLFRFMEPLKGFLGPSISRRAWGSTPLHLAAQVCIRELQEQPGKTKYLVLITDGMPTDYGPRYASVEDMVLDIGSIIAKGRAKGVVTTGLVIGYDVPDIAADLMFGKGGWVRVADDTYDLFESLVELVSKTFAKHLRGR